MFNVKVDIRSIQIIYVMQAVVVFLIVRVVEQVVLVLTVKMVIIQIPYQLDA